MEGSLDEVIISYVQENKWIYDKTDTNYKNKEKRTKFWEELSEILKNVYNIDMKGKILKNL